MVYNKVIKKLSKMKINNDIIKLWTEWTEEKENRNLVTTGSLSAYIAGYKRAEVNIKELLATAYKEGAIKALDEINERIQNIIKPK